MGLLSAAACQSGAVLSIGTVTAQHLAVPRLSEIETQANSAGLQARSDLHLHQQHDFPCKCQITAQQISVRPSGRRAVLDVCKCKAARRLSAASSQEKRLQLSFDCRRTSQKQPSDLRSQAMVEDGSSTSSSSSSSSTKSMDGVRDGGAETLTSTSRFDVSSNCVNPVFRSSPWMVNVEEHGKDIATDKLNIIFLSEGNVCRSVYAEAVFQTMLKENGLEGEISCTSKATRDYNVGEMPDDRVVAVAQEFGLSLRDGAVSRLFDHARDIVLYDLVVVMDKFNAADVLKEVSVYDTINKEGRYSARVRRLGEFCCKREIEEIDDPLYGNMGGPEEEELIKQVYWDVYDSCEGLMEQLLNIRKDLKPDESLKQGVARSLVQMEALDWLVPPMLQKRN